MSELVTLKLNNKIFALISKILLIKDNIHAVVYYKSRKDNSSGKIAIYDLNKINLDIHDSFECEHVSFYYNTNNKCLVDVKLTNVPFVPLSLLISLYNILHLEENNKYIDMEVQGEVIIKYESDDEKIEDLYFRSECRLLDLLLSSDKVKQVFVQNIYTGFHMVSLCENKIVFNQLDDITRANNEIVKKVHILLSKDTITEIEFFVESVPGSDIHYVFNKEMSVFQISVILRGKKITDIRYIENGIAIHLPPNSIITDTDGLIEISVEMNIPSIWKDSYYLTAKNLNNIHHSSMSENDTLKMTIDPALNNWKELMILEAEKPNTMIFYLIYRILRCDHGIIAQLQYQSGIKNQSDYIILCGKDLETYETLSERDLCSVTFRYEKSDAVMYWINLSINPVKYLQRLLKILELDGIDRLSIDRRMGHYVIRTQVGETHDYMYFEGEYSFIDLLMETDNITHLFIEKPQCVEIYGVCGDCITPLFPDLYGMRISRFIDDVYDQIKDKNIKFIKVYVTGDDDAVLFNTFETTTPKLLVKIEIFTNHKIHLQYVTYAKDGEPSQINFNEWVNLIKNSEGKTEMIKEETKMTKVKGYKIEVEMSQGIGSMILLEAISRVCKGKVDELLKTIDYNLRFNPANQFITSAMFVNNLIQLGHLSILSHIMVNISFTEVDDNADIAEKDFNDMIMVLNDYSNLNNFNNEHNTAIRYQIDEDRRYEGNTCYDIEINLRSLVEMCQIVKTKRNEYNKEFVLLIDCISRCNNINIEAKYLEAILDETVNDFKDNTLKSRDLFEKFIPLVSNHEIRPYLHSMLRDVREDISIIDGMYREITSGLGSANNINRTHKAIMINNRGGKGYEDPSNIPLTFVVSGALPILEQALRHSEQLAITKLSGRCTDFNNSIIYFREPANSKDTNTIVKLLETIKTTIKETTKNINAPSEAERFYSCLVGTVSMMVITKPYRLVIKLLTERLAKDAQYEFRHIAKDMKQQIEQELLSSGRISEDAKERIRIDMEELEAIING